MFKAVTENAKTADVVIQAAAPADFTPESVSSQKIKKTGADMAVRLVPTPDIAKTLGENKRPGLILVAFAAETENALENARGKRTRKNADLIVVNDVTRPRRGLRGRYQYRQHSFRERGDGIPRHVQARRGRGNP